MALRKLIATIQSTALYHVVGNPRGCREPLWTSPYDCRHSRNYRKPYDPKKADTLFNLGIVKWQGKKDGPGAVAAWKKLLETNPAYPDKEAVLQLMAQAQQR